MAEFNGTGFSITLPVSLHSGISTQSGIHLAYLYSEPRRDLFMPSSAQRPPLGVFRLTRRRRTILPYESRNIDDAGRRIEDCKAIVLNLQWFSLRLTHLYPKWSSGKVCCHPHLKWRGLAESELVLDSKFLQKYGEAASQTTSSSLFDPSMQRCFEQLRPVRNQLNGLTRFRSEHKPG